MISLQAYPVMDGVEFWVAASCMVKDVSHYSHQGHSVAFYVEAEEIDKLGAPLAFARALERVLTEYSEVADRIRC